LIPTWNSIMYGLFVFLLSKECLQSPLLVILQAPAKWLWLDT